jgi:DNA polymerase (family X)
VIVSNPLTLGRAWDLVDRLVESISGACPQIDSLEAAGDLRRSESLVSSIALVGRSYDPPTVVSTIASLFEPHSILERSDNRIVAIYEHAAVDVLVVTPDRYGTALFRSTGSQAHVSQVTGGSAIQDFATEAQLYASFALDFVPAELRQGTGEVEAARAARLPALVDIASIRGDLHMHTVYSDGRDPVSVMVEGCSALGYEYLAITDHSWGSAASRTLAVETIDRQREEIDQLRPRFPRMAILHGVEVDILPSGRLDFSDAVLERFDIVLASLHDRAGHDGAKLTERSLAAIRHPLVNVLCHPSNQLVGRSAGYLLDFEALYGAAVETGTALEIDGAPSHMDLDGTRARAAIEAGVTLAIDSDCHRVEALGRQMRFGVGIARRGWVGRENVLNTRPVADLLKFIAAKRQRGAGRAG